MSKNSKNIPLCPKCNKNDKMIPIVYGYPSIELLEKAEKNEVIMGGCIVQNERWYCQRDNIES